ncbi:MAG: uridine kinase [Fimbriimonadaceae bacterium]|jgi:uridine kinase|nr:uridine kinase [Fimbriimonadaceae bacterium]
MENRRAVAIAGSTGSGKSTLARDVAAEVGAVILHTDDYYRPLDHLTFEERCEVNFDDPSSIDSELLAQQVRDLLSGQRIQVPCYDFSRHTRFAHSRTVLPAPFVIVEGVFALCVPQVVDLAELRIFVDTPELDCLKRRVKRDVEERGRTPEEVVERFTYHVAPMFRQHVLPTKDLADMVVPGDKKRDENRVAVVRRLLEPVLSRKV